MRNAKRWMAVLGVVAMVLGSGSATPAQVRDVRPDAVVGSPERIAKGCIEKAERAGNACEIGVVKTTKRCLRVVRRLVEAGRLDRAARVAARCEARITEKARRCSTQIEEHCERCVTYLEEIGEPDLAERVKEACSNVLASVADLVARALAAIADALGGGAGDFDESV